MAAYEKYTLPIGEEDQLRLQALNAICNPSTLAFIKQYSLELKGKTIADIGCGTGIMAVEWARLVGSTGKVYAIDISLEQLALAKKYADSLGFTNIDYICQSVDALDELAIHPDWVYSRFLLEHLHDPITALKQMQAMLPVNGYLFCENITGYESLFSDPLTEAFLQWKQAVLLQPMLHGTDFYIGKKLISLFKSLNLSPEKFALNQPLIADKKLKRDFLSALHSDVIQDKYVEKGFYSKDAIALVAKGATEFSQTDSVLSFPQYMQIMGRKQ